LTSTAEKRNNKVRIEIKQSRVRGLEAHEKRGPALSNADLDAAAGTPEVARMREQEAAPEDGAKVSEAIAAMRVTGVGGCRQGTT
jgi:hypothetical protein